MRGIKTVREQLCLVTCLLVGGQGCLADDPTSSGYLDEEERDASVADLDDKVNESVATEELVRRVAALPDKTLVVFDFDDTLMDHVEGQDSRWAAYAKSAVSHLKQRGVAISVCSRNKNSNGSLDRALRGLDSQVFNDAFFKSPAFQDDTGLDKSDDIRQIMAHFGIKGDGQVVFYDDNQGNIDRVNAATNVISIMVGSNGIDRDEFRDGMNRRLAGAPGDGNGTPGSCANKCSSSCRCTAGQGDCDSSSDCASGLVCPPDGDGSEVCGKPSTDTGGGSGNLRVQVGGRWVSVGCGSGAPRADGSSDKWQIIDRKLRNQKGVYLFCGEGWPDGKDCQCSTGSSEAYHAVAQADFNVADSARKYGNMLTESVAARGPLYIFPNNAHEFCLATGANNIIENKDGGDDGSHHESAHKGKCNQWCFGGGCP